MAGTKIGGMKAAATNKKRYGKGFYAKIGRIGGENGHRWQNRKKGQKND